MTKTYTGSCHCGAVRFEADLDLSRGTMKCNCTICIKMRIWSALVPPGGFRLLSGEADLTDYRPHTLHRLFCRHCGTHVFEWGDPPGGGGRVYVIRVNCLDDVEPEELIHAPVTYYDGT